MSISEVTGQRCSVAASSAGTSVALTYPGTPTQGRLMIAAVGIRVGSNSVSNVPTGWNLMGTTYNTTNVKIHIYWKLAGASEATTHTWTLTNSYKFVALGFEYDATEGWMASPNGVYNGNAATSGTTGLSTNASGTSNAGASAQILVFVARVSDNIYTWSAQSGTNFTTAEKAEAAATGGTSSTRCDVSVSAGISSSNASFTETATLSSTGNWAAMIATFYENIPPLTKSITGDVVTATDTKTFIVGKKPILETTSLTDTIKFVMTKLLATENVNVTETIDTDLDMALALILRMIKGSNLTTAEFDGDFNFINTNKLERVVSNTVSTSSLTPDTDHSDFHVTALAEDCAVNAPTGTLKDGKTILIRFKDNGTIRNLSWNSIFRCIGTTLPSVTVSGKFSYVGIVYNSEDSKWDVIATA